MCTRLSMILVCCAFLGIVDFVAMNFQMPHALAAPTAQYQMRMDHPLSESGGRISSIGDVATIQVSASTNTCSSTIKVYATGIATYKTCAHRGRHVLDRSVLSQFFEDIQQAQPLNELPQGSCFKSISFGTSTYISTGGIKSPDISCASSPIEQNLIDDVHTIEGILKLNFFLR
jgi:hypothetical protein